MLPCGIIPLNRQNITLETLNAIFHKCLGLQNNMKGEAAWERRKG